MAISVRNEGAKVNSNINVTPMVDVMLVLLIIFMGITPMLQKGQSVDLAKATHPMPSPHAANEDAVIGAGMGEGQRHLETRKERREELRRKGKNSRSRRPNEHG